MNTPIEITFMTKEPNFCIIDKLTNETYDTCETLKEAIQIMDFKKHYIYDNTKEEVVRHIEY